MYSVYLGAAIDLAQTLNPFEEMAKILTGSSAFEKAIIFRPDTAWNNAVKSEGGALKYLMDVNNYAVDNSDLGVFRISPNVYSQGVPMEITRRVERNKPTYVIAEKVGLYLKGLQLGKPYIRFYSSMEEFKEKFQGHWESDSCGITKPLFRSVASV